MRGGAAPPIGPPLTAVVLGDHQHQPRGRRRDLARHLADLGFHPLGHDLFDPQPLISCHHRHDHPPTRREPCPECYPSEGNTCSYQAKFVVLLWPELLRVTASKSVPAGTLSPREPGVTQANNQRSADPTADLAL